MGNKKGQMFIIATLFIIVIIVLIRNMVGTLEISEENRFQESRLIEKNLRNAQNEFRDANQSGMDYMRNLSLQMRSDMDIQIIYIYAVSNNSNNKYSVTMGNYLQDRMNITFNATNSNPGGRIFIIEDKANLTREYTSSVNGTISINVSYTAQNQDTAEKFNITSNTKSNIFLFTDITVRSNEFFVRGKDFYNWSWPV